MIQRLNRLNAFRAGPMWLLSAAITLGFTPVAHALSEMEEADMADINGRGIAFLPENFKVAFNDLAYIQAIPTALPVKNNVADLYWYGLQLSGANSAGPGTGNVTSRAGFTTSTVNPWGSADNPWLLKVESPSGFKYTPTVAGAKENYPVVNYYAPRVLSTDITASGIDNGGLKYAFWGDVIARDKTSCSGKPTTCTEISRMQSQSIWNDFTLNGSRLSIFQNTYDQSFGLSWINRINSKATGVMRFSVAETAAVANNAPQIAVPTFNNLEGIFITDMDINMIVGVQHYQPVILDNSSNTNDPATVWDETKNFSIEVVRIPSNASIYGDFYRDYSLNTAAQLAKMCTNSTPDCSGATHGQISMGNLTFKDPGGAATDLGGVLIDGLMIQHLKITTTGI